MFLCARGVYRTFVQKLNPKKVYINFIIELEGLKGREIFPADAEIDCLLTLEGK